MIKIEDCDIFKYINEHKFCCFDIPGECDQEGKFDISLFPPPEAYTAILFIHSILYHSSIDHVPARSSNTSMGGLLCSWSYVRLKYPSRTAFIPLYRPLPSL